jgi:glycosyltransferase involved in cell wall biosynthesis
VQLGAREHYAVPRALHSIGALDALVTDFWTRSSRSKSGFLGKLGDRFHPDLRDAAVYSGGVGWAATEGFLRARRALLDSSDWNLLISRNALFDRMARRRVERLIPRQASSLTHGVFAYSYAATTTLAAAAASGCNAVLGQIDGGPAEEQIVLEEIGRYPQLHERYRAAPARYWNEWRSQCASAHRIMVNSPWARECLLRSGISDDKIVTVPLYYEAPRAAAPKRVIPARFSAGRALRVLFLGQVNLRKGAGRLFDAIRMLKTQPIEFLVVGPTSVTIPDGIMALSNFTYAGPANRSEVQRYYDEADVFILPTLSDGFALTQLEAQSHGLPVIASEFCGPVVTHGVNGLVLRDVTADAIAESLLLLLADPPAISRMQANARSGLTNLRDYASAFVEEVCR